MTRACADHGSLNVMAKVCDRQLPKTTSHSSAHCYFTKFKRLGLKDWV
ncbi:hypothetical protein BDK62_103216 [Halomonas alkaliantarctica]|nr:hypothetical protein BDK62_103216 [Halomonas alkaliantarctica]